MKRHISHDGVIATGGTFEHLGLTIFHDDYSLAFNGTDEYLNAGDICDYESTDPFSICFWVKSTGGSGEPPHPVMSRFDGMELQGWSLQILDATGYPHFRLAGGGGNEIEAIFQTDVFDDNWHFVVLRYSGSGDAAGVTCYVDDVAATPSVLTDTFSGSARILHDCYIGATDDVRLLGNLDDISVWEKVLTTTEMTNLYAGGRPRHVGRYSEPENDTLIHYWRMGDAISGSYVIDEVFGFGNALFVNMDASNRDSDVPTITVPITSDLFSYYKFNEQWPAPGYWTIGSHTVLDSSGNARNMDFTLGAGNVVATATGVKFPPTHIFFNGNTTPYAQAQYPFPGPPLDAFSFPFSVSFWFYDFGGPAYPAYFLRVKRADTWANVHEVGMNYSGGYKLLDNSNPLLASLFSASPSHAVMVFHTSGLVDYLINGVWTAGLTTTLVTGAYDYAVAIGNAGSDVANRYRGTVDELAVWSGRALSETECLLLWNSGAGLEL